MPMVSHSSRNPAVQHHDLDGPADPQRAPVPLPSSSGRSPPSGIRDKDSRHRKRKGLWVGGALPLGYEMRDGQKSPSSKEEAELVRSIFRRYLELGSVNELFAGPQRTQHPDQNQDGSPTGCDAPAGSRFGRGALYYLLSNHFSISARSNTRMRSLPGEQPPIMDRALFDAGPAEKCPRPMVPPHHCTQQVRSATGRIAVLTMPANSMIPTHATKAGIRYRYYVSTPWPAWRGPRPRQPGRSPRVSRHRHRRRHRKIV